MQRKGEQTNIGFYKYVMCGLHTHTHRVLGDFFSPYKHTQFLFCVYTLYRATHSRFTVRNLLNTHNTNDVTAFIP